MLDNIKMQNNEEFLMSGRFNILDYSRTNLWRDLAVWTNAYFISNNTDKEHQDAVFKRLYNIPNAFGKIISIVFGESAARQYITLLSQHIIILQSIIDAMREGDQDTINENTVKLYENADDRVAFLVHLNPYWEENIWLKYFYSYLNLILQLITSFLVKDYDKSIRIYDSLMFHTSLMGDYFSNGLFEYTIKSS